MWKKWLVAFSLAAVVFILCGSTVLAATSAQVSTKTIAMRGQAAVVNAYPVSQLRLKTQANDSSGWLLEVILNPVSPRSDGEDNQGWNVSGTFTLGMSGQSLATGTVTGWVYASGTGYIMLSGSRDVTSLQMSFNVANDDSVTAAVQGSWPAVPVPQTTPASSAPVQPANHFFWYLSRSAAIAAYILLFINLCLGIGLKTRYLDKILNRWRVLDLHQFTGLLAVGLVLLHVFSLLGDSYYSFSLPQLFVPGASPYRPAWVALGVIGFYALLVITFSWYIRRFIGQKMWRVIHYGSFLFVIIVFFHAIKSGTDTGTAWTQWLYISTGTFLAFLILARFLGSRSAPPAAPVPVRKTRQPVRG